MSELLIKAIEVPLWANIGEKIDILVEYYKIYHSLAGSIPDLDPLDGSPGNS